MQCNSLGFMLQVRLLDTLWCFDRNLLNCTWGRLEQETDGGIFTISTALVVKHMAQKPHPARDTIISRL